MSFCSRPDLFNQYRDSLPEDEAEAYKTRTAQLSTYLSMYDEPPATFILAEAPGPWGCRYTGIPITSEVQLIQDNFPIAGRPCTVGEPRAEYSAGIFWRVLQGYADQFVVWNAVPFHPHHPGKPDSIRTPRSDEIKEFSKITALVLELFRPMKVLALGRRAESQLSHLGIDSHYVRHPSQGGARLFEKGMLEIFGRDINSLD